MGLFDKFKKATKYEKNKELNKLQHEQMGSESTDNQMVLNHTKQFTSSEKEKKEYVLSLTPREKDIYLLLIEGFTLKEAAKQSGIKYSTANTHMTQIYKKLKVNTKAELIINYRNIK